MIYNIKGILSLYKHQYIKNIKSKLLSCRRLTGAHTHPLIYSLFFDKKTFYFYNNQNILSKFDTTNKVRIYKNVQVYPYTITPFKEKNHNHNIDAANND